jgi:CBS domain containing-hemolysin-like protein
VLPLFADLAEADADGSATKTVLGLIAIPLLILVNAFFVAAEFALVAIRRTRVEELVNAGRHQAKALLRSINALNDSVAAAQLGITVASLALGFVSEPALHRVISQCGIFDVLPDAWQGPISRTISIITTLSLITFLHVVFGEQMPKIAALQSSERIGLWVAGPLNVFARMTRPLIRLMNGTSTWCLRQLGYKADPDAGEVHTVEELRLLIEDTEEAGLLEPQQADVVLNVFALANKKVRDVMVPWDKVAALDVSASPGDVMTTVRNGAHTRLPVYDGDKNKIVGVVNTKDLFYLFSTSGVVSLIDAVYEPVFLDANESVSVALELFRKAHRHLAIVREVDGTVVGILTLEDVLEEIVGEIEDEHDIDVPKLRRAVAQQLLLRRRAEAARPVLTRGPAASEGASDP